MIKEQDNLFENRIRYEGNIPVVESTAEERAQYLKYFETVVSLLKEWAGGTNGFWIVGGLARDAVMHNENFVVMDVNGNWRDIDILVDSDHIFLIDRLRKENPTPVLAHGATHNVLKITKTNVLAEFGSISIPLSKEVFYTQMISLGNVDFPSLPANTLLHMYSLGERPRGKMREKDFINALALARHLKNYPDPQFREESYSGFHEFARLRNVKKQKSVSYYLLVLARAYRESFMNKIVPINSKNLMPILEHVLQIIGRAERSN